MPENSQIMLVLIVVLGAAAQWLSWRVGLPSILLLLVGGFVIGPVTHVVDPDQLLGHLLLPLVSLSVALILYEGGLSLKLSELSGQGRVVRNLVLTGALVTWLISSGAAYLLFGFGWQLSILLGAVLVVTGPTVIIPMLNHIRPSGPVGTILKWEGIVIDPIGALLAVLVFEIIVIPEPSQAAAQVALAIAKTIFIGGGLGLAAAAILVLLMRRFWVPDYLQNATSLMFVLTTFMGANHVQHESGFLAVTVMGLALANQKFADIRHIVEFKENLRTLLISSLFIVLAARLRIADLTSVAVAGTIFVFVLIVIARPAAVWVSTLGSKLGRRERAFLACMAPRGIVAAAVASVFALRLQEAGYEQARMLVPITFAVIVWTVVVYGLASPWIARRLRLAESNPQGVLFVGGDAWVRALAQTLNKNGFRVLLVDSNRQHTAAARMSGLSTFTGSILADNALERMDLGGIGRILAVTPNEWVNVLAVQRFSRIFGGAECYQLPPEGGAPKEKSAHRHLHGRWLFGTETSESVLASHVALGATVKATPLTEEFGYAEFQRRYGNEAIPLMVISEDKALRILTADSKTEPRAGQTLVSLVHESNM